MKRELRDYQIAGKRDIYDAFRAGSKRALFVLPTGGGKTVILADIVRDLHNRGRRVVIVVHRQELVEQVSQTLFEIGVPHGHLASWYPPYRGENVCVASVWTLARKRLPAWDLVILDEAHHAAAATWNKLFDGWSGTPILGVTATPQRLDGKGLGTYFDRMVLGPSTQDLVDAGYLAPPIVYAPPSSLSLAGVKKVAGDYERRAAAAAITESHIVGDAVKHYKQHCGGRPALAFCCTVDHAKAVAGEFADNGIVAGWVSGEQSVQERSRLISSFRSGKLQLLASCELISEGFDVPGAWGAILLRPTKSTSCFLQQVGRALRPASGKTHAIILDHVGNSLVHGLPTEPREWSLDGRDPKAAPIPSKRCSQCFAIMPISATVCAVCGSILKADAPGGGGRALPKKVEGELEALTAAGQYDWARMAYRDVMRMARTPEQLKEAAAARGYGKGWINRILINRGAGPREFGA